MYPSIRRFLDVEACEDDQDDTLDSEEEEEFNSIFVQPPVLCNLTIGPTDYFLDDGLESDGHPSGHPTFVEVPDNCERTLDRLIDKILTNTHAGRTSRCNYAHEEEESSTVGNVICLPREGNYPLWRVKCQVRKFNMCEIQ